jgi:hypothetical protein
MKKWLSRKVGNLYISTGKRLVSYGYEFIKKGENLVKESEETVVTPETIETIEEENLSIYLSRLIEIFKRYGVEMKDDYSFMRLRESILIDGKRYVITQMKEVIEKLDGKSSSDIAKELINKYNELFKEENSQYNRYKKEIAAGKIDKNSPLIYPEILDPYHKKLGLSINNRADFEDAICRVLDHIYNIGIKEALGTFEVNIEFIEKYLKQNKEKSVEKEIKEISEKINNLLKEISAKTQA